MAMFKSAQLLEVSDQNYDEDQVILYEPHMDDVEVGGHEGEEPIEIHFQLEKIPGSDSHDLEVSTDDSIEVAEESVPPKKEMIEVTDPWDWQGHGLEKFLEWVKNRFNSIPRHSGETVGIERAIAYLKKLNNELSKAVSNDFDGKIDIQKLEAARKEIYSGIDRLEDAKEMLDSARSSKKRSRGSENMQEIVKEAQKTTGVGGIVVTVPLLISSIARICINSTVSAGKDIERTADELINKYKLNEREQMELIQLISDMGFPVRRPRGYDLDQKIDPSSVDNHDWAAQYYS